MLPQEHGWYGYTVVIFEVTRVGSWKKHYNTYNF
jgi:hypothetical protein